MQSVRADPTCTPSSCRLGDDAQAPPRLSSKRLAAAPGLQRSPYRQGPSKPMRYRIALCGFGEFEHRALRFSIEHAATVGGAAYEVVAALAQADFAVVDADSPPAVKGVALAGRMAQAVFVGAVAP